MKYRVYGSLLFTLGSSSKYEENTELYMKMTIRRQKHLIVYTIIKDSLEKNLSYEKQV